MRDKANRRKDGTVAERSGSCGWANSPLTRRRPSVLERLSRVALVLVLIMPLLVFQHAEASRLHTVDELARAISRWWPPARVPPLHVPPIHILTELPTVVRTFGDLFDTVEAPLLIISTRVDDVPLTQKDIRPLVKELTCLYAENALNGKVPTADEVGSTVSRYRLLKRAPFLANVYMVKGSLDLALNGRLNPADFNGFRLRLGVFWECTAKG